ncbi:MAG: acyltransferase [Treponema sp.]|nr:acyltransferase [Treponema sp.]
MDTQTLQTETETEIKVKPLLTAESSKKITALRYILMMLVVFGHNNYTIYSVGSDMVFNQSVFGKWVQLLISDGIARGAVPLFFAMSSFLLFFKNDAYVVMLKKKVHSLLLPFIIWPLLNMLFFALCKFLGDVVHVGFLAGVGNYDFLTWSFKDWIKCYFGYYGDGLLYLSQFWFMRDLIILVILSPVLSFIYEKAKYLTVIGLLYLEFAGVQVQFVTTESLFYFFAGMIWAKSGKDLFEMVKNVHWYQVILLFLGTWFIFWKFQFAPVTTICLMALADAVMLAKFSEVLIKNEKVYNLLAYLAKYSFFLYAVHIKILRAIIRTTWLKLFPMKNGFFCLFEYFGVTFTIVIVGTLIGIFLKKFLPKFFALISGR